MTRIKFFAFFTLLIAFASLLTSCNGDLFGTKEPTDITISDTLLEFDTIAELQGKNLQLSAKITMKDGSESTDVVWTVPEDTSAFKVYATSKGVLTFQILKAGTYVVHAGAKYNDEIVKTAQCVITIKDALTGLEIAKVGDSAFDSTTLSVGSTLDLMTIYTPAATSQTDVRWSVDNSDVVSVTEQPNGRAIVTGKAAGTAVVTVRSTDNQKITDKVTILVQESGASQKFGVRSIEVTPGTGEIEVGKSLTLSAKVLDGNANEITSGTVSFSIEGSGATVSSSGRNAVVTAVKGGEVTLHASFTYDGATVTADVPITITGDVDDIAVSSSFINSQVGDTETIEVLYSPEDTSRKGFNYSVSDQNVVLVTGQTDSSLTFRTLSEGRATIVITSRYDSAKKTSVIVNGVAQVSEASRIQKITLSSNALTYYPPFTGGDIEAYVYRRADNGTVSVSEESRVNWSSSDETVLTVTADSENPKIAHITQIAPGKATVTATSKDNPEVSSSAVVSVLGSLESIIPSSTTINVPVGGMDVITLTPYPSYAVYSKPVISTSNDGILTDLGLRGTNIWGLDVTGLSTGTTTAYVYVDGRRMASVNINVYLADAAAVRNIELSETSLALAQDADPYFISATALDKDGITVGKQVGFAPASEIAEQVALIERIGDSNDFYVTPLNAGSADYLFTVEGNTYASTRLHIEVGGGAVQGETTARQIRPQADSVSIQKGNTAVMTLNVIPLGAETGNITWTVSDLSVASVTGNGLECTIWGLSAGKARITATTDKGLSASFNVTVTEAASVTDTRVSYITVSSGSETSHTVTSSLRRSITLSARSFSASGEAIRDTYSWSVEGDAVQAVQTSGSTEQFSIITRQYAGMDSPAVIRATSNSNPNVWAEFRVYVSADTTVSADAPQVLPEVSGITLEAGVTKTYSYRILPVTYYGEFRATLSTDAATAEIDSAAKTISITAQHAGTSVLTLSDGNASAQIRITVVNKAQVIDSTITAITLDRSYLSYDLAQKAPQTITATVYRNGIASRDEKITWTVSDEELAGLTINGSKATVAVKGITGTTTIVATATENPDVSASCYVEIIDSTAISQHLRYIMLSESSVSMKTGESLTLTVSGQPVSALQSAEIRWASDDESVATVSNGRIRAVGEGLANITVTAEGLSDACRVYVSDDTVSSATPRNIVLSDILMNISQENMDRVYTVSADVLSATGSYITDRGVVWSVEDPNGAIEHNSAYNSFSFSPRNAGTAVVTASMDNVTAQVKIVVGASYAAPETLKSIRIYPSKLTLEVGDISEIRALTVPSDNGDNLSWAVSTPATVQVTPSGRTAEIKGIKGGASTVTVYSAENPDISAQIQVDVKEKGSIAADEVTGITLDRSSITLDMNEKALTTVKATVYKNGKASTGEVIWTYTQGAAAAVEAYNMGNNTISLTKRTVGSGYITATSKDDESFSVSCHVEVIDSATVVSKTLLNAMLSSTSVSLEEGDAYQLNIVTIPAELEGVEVAYASTDEGVAKVSATGLVTAVSQGRADIRVIITQGSRMMSLTCSVSVYERDEAIQIQPSAVRFSENAVYLSQDNMDTAKTVTATVIDQSFQEIDGALVYWEIDNPEVARIVKNGNSLDIFPLSAGRATVKATYRNVSNTIAVVVGSPASALTNRTTAITFDTSSAIMSVGETKTVKANLVPAGVEDRVAYTVNDASVVALTRNEDGTLTLEALKTGNAVITATSVSYPSIKATMNVSVRETTEGIITSIELDKHYISLTIGEKALTELKATAYVDGKATKNVNLTWSLEGLTDAQLGLTRSDSYGSSVYLTKKASGEGFVVVSSPDGSVSARCQVEITEIQQSTDTVKYIRLSENLMNLSQEKMDKTYTVTAGAYTADNRLMSRQVAWTVEDPDNSIIWEAGANTITVSPRNAGTAVITASVENVEAKARIIVGALSADTSASSLSVSPANLLLSVGQEHTVSAAVLPVSSGNSILWTTNAPAVASVEPDGNNATVRGLSAGTATITAQVVGTGLVKNITVRVESELAADAVSSVTLDKTSITFDLAEKNLTTLKATVLKGSGAASGQVDWSMDDSLSGIITYTEIGNNVIGLTKGTQTGSGYITATSHDNPEFHASCFVQVIDSTTAEPGKLLAASLSSTTISVGSGDTYQFSVQILPEDLEGYDIYWTSSDESIARVSEEGKLTAVAPGRATVSANVVKDGRVITLSCSVSVYANVSDAVTPSVITFSDNVIYLSQDNMDTGTEITARILDSSYNEMKFTDVDSWSVEQDGNIISLLSNGNTVVVYPQSAGKAVVTATYKNIENSFMVIVGTPTEALGTSVRNMVFSTSSIVLGKGNSEQITAYVIPSGADSSVAFATDNPNVISAVSDGNTVTVTGTAAGSANIRAISLADPSVSGMIRVTVVENAENAVTSIKLDKSHIALSIDDRALTQVKATAYSGNKVVDADIEWTLEGLDDSQLGIVSLDTHSSAVSLVKRSAGSGYLKASTADGTVFAKCLVEITGTDGLAGIPSRIILSQDMLYLSQEHMDEYTMVSASVVDLAGRSLDNTVTWTISDSRVAKVAVSGNRAMVYPLSGGVARLTATSGSASNSVMIVVGAAYLSDGDTSAVLLSSNKVLVPVGSSVTVRGSIIPVSSSEADVTWTGGSAAIAEITAVNGNSVTITGRGAGGTWFTASNGDGSVSSSLEVIVRNPADMDPDEVTYVTLDKSSVTLDISERTSTVITATAGKGDGSQDGEVDWVADPSLTGVISMTDIGDNTVSVVKRGTGSGYITAKSKTDSTFVASVYVEVIDSATSEASLRFINLSEHLSALQVGEKTVLTVSGYPASQFAGRTVVWGTSDASVAAVSNGTVYATGAGTAVITATVDGTAISDSCTVNVYTDEVGVLAIRMDNSRITMSVNEMAELGYTVIPSGASEHLIWSSSDRNVVQVSRTGAVTAKAPGNATVTVYDYVTGAFAATDIEVLSTAVTGSVTGINVNPSSLTMRRLSSVRLRVYALPDNMSDSFIYGVSDESVAIVDEERSDETSVVLTGLKVGSTTLTVTSVSNPSVSRNVPVNVVTDISDVVTAVTPSRTTVSMVVGGLTEVSAKVYVDNKAVTGRKLNWSTEQFADGTVTVTPVDSFGSAAQISALQPGSGYVVATVDEGTEFARIFVEIKPQTQQAPQAGVSAVELSDNTVYLSQEGGRAEISAIIRATDGSVLAGPVVWSTTDESVFTVEYAGNTAVLTPQSAGTAKLRASYSDVSAEAVVFVGSPSIADASSMTAVHINPSRLTIAAGAQDTLVATVEPAGTQDSLSWAVSNPTVIALEQNGRSAVVTGLASGTATVTAYASENARVMDTTEITVKPFVSADEVTGVRLSRSSVSLDLAERTDVSVSATVYKGGKASDGAVAWTPDASLEGVVDVRVALNTVSLVKRAVGSGYITVSSVDDPDFFAVLYVEVTDSSEPASGDIALRGIVLSTSSVTIAKGATHTFSLAPIPTEAAGYSVIWKSGDATIVSVDQEGKVTGLEEGTTYVRATVTKGSAVFERTATVRVTGSAVALSDFMLSDQSLVLRLNESYTVRTTMIPENAEGELSWASSDISVARVTQNGTITGVGEGNAIISVHNYANDIHKAVTVQVLGTQAQDARASFIRLSVQSVELSQTGGTRDVTASVIADDGYPLAGAVVTWAMDKEGIASMSVDGNTVTLSGLDSGRTTLRAYYGNLSASASVYTGMIPGMDVATLDHITATPAVLTIQTGSEGQISLSTYPAGLEINPVWQSGDTTIATVASSFNGQTEATVKAVKQGNTTVTARNTATEKTAVTTIRVRDDISTAVTGITTDRTSLTLDVNKSAGADVTATIYVANNVSATEPLTWTFVDDQMNPSQGIVSFTATDASKRTVTVRPLAVGSGYLKVSATNDNEVYALVYVNVIDSTTVAQAVTELRLEFDAISMAKGTTRRFNAVTIPSGVQADIRWAVENQSTSGVAAVDIYGNVSALAAGTADIKAYIASNPSISDTVVLTVTETQQGGSDTPSVYDIGAVTISPATATLSQEASYPTAFTAKVFDTNGRELKTENVVWNTDGLNDVAEVVRTEGNVIYLSAKSAGRGELVAQRTSRDNTVISGTAFIYTGAVETVDPENPVLTSFAFGSSSPIYLVAENHETRTVSLQYRPDVQALKGAVWTYTGAEGHIQTVTTDTSVTITALEATQTNAQIMATSTAKDAEGHSMTATLGVKVVATEADLPEVTTLVLDRSAIILNLAERADTVVKATAYDHNGNEVKSAVITWELRGNSGTNVTLTTTAGRSVGINKGSHTGTVNLVAVCGEIEAVCAVTVIDSVEFGGIALSTDSIHLTEGATTQITVFGNPESLFTGEVSFAKGGDTGSIEVTGTSDRTRFIITAVEEGTATIRFSTAVNGNTYTADATVFVNSAETLGVSRITLNPASAYLEKNGTVQLTARLYDRKGNTVNSSITFASTDPSVASVQASGSTATVTALKEGMTTIIARAGEVEALTFISVGSDPEGDGSLKAIIPGMSTVTMAKNDRLSVNVATVPANFSGTLNAASNRENVVTAFVTGRTLTLNAVGAGSAVVTLSIGQMMATVDVTVSGESTPATIRFNKNAISLTQEPGASETVTAYVYDAQDVRLGTVVEDWSVDNASIARITDNGNGSVTVEPLNAGATTVTARINGIASSFRVSVNEKTSTASGPSSIVLDTPSLRLRRDETALVGSLYQPAGLSDDAKAVTWTTTDASVATVTAFGIEQAVVEGKGPGSATITATSRANAEVSASMTVTVPDDATAQTTDTYLITLDKTDVRMEKTSRVMLTATLYRNGEKVDASNVDWSFENNDNPKLLDFVVSGGTASTAKAGTVSVLSSNRTGFAYVIASYNGATARAQIEVADLNVVEDTGLRSIVFSSSTMLMEVGEQATFTTSLLPAVTGVSYTWTQMKQGNNGQMQQVGSNPLVRFLSTKDGSVTLEALQEGKAVITVSARLEDYTPVTASVTIDIVAAGSADAEYSYSGMKLSTSGLTLSQGADATYITATLLDTDGKDTSDTVYGWRLLYEDGTKLLEYNHWDYQHDRQETRPYSSPFTNIATAAYTTFVDQAEFQDIKAVNGDLLIEMGGKKATELAQDFSVIGEDHRMLRFVPGRAGLYFIEAFGPTENGVAVTARAIVYVTGSITDAAFSSNYIHMIKGDSQMLTVSLSPSTASIKSSDWKLSDATPGTEGMENAYLKLGEAGERTVIVNAQDVEGVSNLTYEVTDVNGNKVSASTTIVVHDPSYGTGGIRNISFGSQFVTMSYPYTAQTYKASAYYMDGSKAEDQDITYDVQVSVGGVWKSLPDNHGGRICDAYTGESAGKWEGETSDAKLIATFTQGNGGITVVPQGKGVFRVVANLTKDSQDFSSEMYVTVGGDSNRITPSSSSVVLYTGGSAEISFSLDNPGYNGKLSWQILSETTSDGYLIEEDKIVATGENMRSVFKSTSGTIEGKSLALGARILAANAIIANTLHNSAITDNQDILGSINESDTQRDRIVETFPRSAILRVSTADNQSSVDINITVRRLPESNTYPVAIKLSQDKVDLTPPFSSEQTISASLLDQQGKETTGTIEWYLYPIGTADWATKKTGDEETSPLKYKLDTDKHVIDNDYADYYFNGDTMYYTPKKAGIYRLTVKCTQNPQLEYTSTLNVAGDVTGISASTGATLQVAKNNSTEISAVFEPASALARTVYFGLDNANGTAIVPSGGNLSNEHIRVSMVGTSSSVTVTGLQGTTGSSIQKIRLIYPATTTDETNMTLAITTAGGLDKCYLVVEGNGLNKTVTYSVHRISDNQKVGDSFNAYSYSVEVSVTVDKAIYSFSTTSNRSIDPSSLESGRISFDMVATATSEGGSSVSPFSHWDWVEMQIVGDESGEVYASSVPVTDIIDGKWYSLYDKDGDGIADDYYDGTGWVYDYTGNGSRYYNHLTREFTLINSKGYATDKVLVSGGTAYGISTSYTKQQLDVNVSEIKSMRDSSNDSTGIVHVVVDSKPLAVKSGGSSGRLDTDNGGSTWFFTLDTDAIGDETLRIRVRLRDDIAYGPVVAGGYDSEAMSITESNLSLTIGGKINSLSTGTVIRENHGGTTSQTLETGIEQIKLYEGASVTLIPSFNPSNTHQKGLEWRVTDNQGNDKEGDWYVTSSKYGSQLMLTANAFGAISEDHRIVYVTARSTADPSVYCRYEIDIQTLVKSLQFTAISQKQTNKNVQSGISASPTYVNIAVDQSPVTEGTGDIYCFDTTDVSGGGGNVDAYYITYTPVPDYGYDFELEIVSNKVKGSNQIIGEIETLNTGTDNTSSSSADGTSSKKTRAFRFVPTGRVYSEYDDNGQGKGDYTVAYGDVTVMIKNTAINYSKEFTIHYQPAGFRLVKYVDGLSEIESRNGHLAWDFIPDTSGEGVSSNTLDDINGSWDLYWNETEKVQTLKGIECLVFYPSEEAFPLTLAGTYVMSSLETVGNTINKTYVRNYDNPKSITPLGSDGEILNSTGFSGLEVKWTLSADKNGSAVTDLVTFADQYGTVKSGQKQITGGDSGEWNHIYLKAGTGTGVAYLAYEIRYPLFDKNGNIIQSTIEDEDGNLEYTTQYVTMSGGIPIYVISAVDPEMVKIAQYSLQKYNTSLNTTYLASLIPENISRAQIDKWYGISPSYNINDSDGNILAGKYLFRGKAYAIFDGTGNALNVGTRSVIRLGNVQASIDDNGSLTDKKVPVLLGTNSSNALRTIPSEILDSNFLHGNPRGGEYQADTYEYTKRDDNYLWVRTYKSVNLYSLEDMTWVKELVIDMTTLTPGDNVSVGVSLADLMAVAKDGTGSNSTYSGMDAGDFSKTGLESISINGKSDDKALGFSTLTVKPGCKLTLSGTDFKPCNTDDVISGCSITTGGNT